MISSAKRSFTRIMSTMPVATKNAIRPMSFLPFISAIPVNVHYYLMRGMPDREQKSAEPPYF